MQQLTQNLKNLIEYPKGGILSKAILKTERINLTLFCLAQGTEISEHTSTKEGFVYVLEGKGIFNLEDQNIEMRDGVFIAMNKNAPHALKAKKNTAFLLALFE